MTDFVVRIDSILKEKNLKRAALCSDLRLSSTSITDWTRRGTIPAGDICLKIAQYLDVSVEWLITGKETGYTNEERNIIAQWRELDTSQKDTLKTLLDKWEADRMAQKKHITEA